MFGGACKRAPADTAVRDVLGALDPAVLEVGFRAHSQALLAAQGEGSGRCMVDASRGHRLE